MSKPDVTVTLSERDLLVLIAALEVQKRAHLETKKLTEKSGQLVTSMMAQVDIDEVTHLRNRLREA